MIEMILDVAILVLLIVSIIQSDSLKARVKRLEDDQLRFRLRMDRQDRQLDRQQRAIQKK
jgi:hypothetical protein